MSLRYLKNIIQNFKPPKEMLNYEIVFLSYVEAVLSLKENVGKKICLNLKKNY